jgi:hypothetical protein
MNTTRTVFGKHASGHVFPMLLNVQSMPDSDCFIGILQELKTSDEFILFMSLSKTVTEATKGSFGLLQVSRNVIAVVFLLTLSRCSDHKQH